MLRQRFDLEEIKRTITTKDRLAMIHGKQRVETMVRCSRKKTTESMDRFAIIEGQKIVETTDGASSKKSVKPSTLLKQRLDFQTRNRLNLWIVWP